MKFRSKKFGLQKGVVNKYATGGSRPNSTLQMGGELVGGDN